MEFGIEIRLIARETVMTKDEQQQMGEGDEIHNWHIKFNTGKRQITEEEQHQIGGRNEIQNWNMTRKRETRS